FRIRAVHRSRRLVRVTGGRDESVRFARHRESAPPCAVAAVSREIVERLPRRLLDVGRKCAAIGERRQPRTSGSNDDKRADGSRQADDRNNKEIWLQKWRPRLEVADG